MAGVDHFAERLLHWYSRYGRSSLPWQNPATPYRVWVSEIMLQQTRVETVIPYFQRFMARFPDIDCLARAPLDDVMHLWSGLGYYSRAHNLHRTAGIIADGYDGVFPCAFDQIVALPGIGRSTAGAILALSMDCRHAILDGNVKRVLARYHAVTGWPGEKDTQDRLWRLAESHTPARSIREYTQAIMDLGALVCTRRNARCPECPLTDGCQARTSGRQDEFPAPRPRRTTPTRSTIMLLLRDSRERILLIRRPPTGVWANLWSLPEFDHLVEVGDWGKSRLNCNIELHQQWPLVRHSFTHFRLEIQPVVGTARNDGPVTIMEDDQAVWYNTRYPDQRGLAAPVSQLLKSWHESIK